MKDKPILVITGNPPYSGHSKNKGVWISAAIDGYKHTVERDAEGREFKKPLGERNPKWLNDDYVKFIRFAQLKMDAVDEGIVGIITNHSWLDNPTFRGMRQSLMRSFEQIYVLDLHGNAKKKEKAPDGSKDENVFDIEQSVAISIFVKKGGLKRTVFRGDIWGARLEKYKATAEVTIAGSDWTSIEPSNPQFMYEKQNTRIRSRYDQYQSLRDMFSIGSVGVVTAADKTFISFRDNDLKDSISNSNITFDSRLVQRIAYRPFDSRKIYYDKNLLERPRYAVMQHMISKGNISLAVTRQVKATESWQHCFVAAEMSESTLISNKTSEICYCFPLLANGREALAHDFRIYIDALYGQHYTAEELLGFIYAILNSPSYRIDYAEFLRIDFPRIPFPEKSSDFERLSGLGWALVEAHLMRNLARKNLAAYHGKGDHTVEFVRYSPEEKSITINNTQLFKPVPEDLWDFHIGGYQVLDKYLKSRKGRQLALDEINHISAVADSLAFTIEQMAKIDKAYKAAFPDRG